MPLLADHLPDRLPAVAEPLKAILVPSQPTPRAREVPSPTPRYLDDLRQRMDEVAAQAPEISERR